MLANPDHIVVTTEENPILAVRASTVYHRHFPEIRGQGDSPAAAIGRLADHLSRTLDNVPSDWRRERLLEAIADVRAFTQRERGGLINRA
jgi:hypothetical protein